VRRSSPAPLIRELSGEKQAELLGHGQRVFLLLVCDIDDIVTVIVDSPYGEAATENKPPPRLTPCPRALLHPGHGHEII